MGKSTRSPGVSLSVRWGNQALAREFLPLHTPRSFTIGAEPGCDFACGGAKAFRLIHIDAEGATLRQKDGTRMPLKRGSTHSLSIGALSFDAQLLDAPPRLAPAAVSDLTTINLGLALIAAFGFFAVTAANADAAGEDFDENSGVSAKAIKVLYRQETAKQASAAPAAKQRKDNSSPPSSPSRVARTVPVPRPSGKNVPSTKPDVGALFHGPGAGSVFTSSGLGDDLRAASNGIRTAQVGIGSIGLGGGRDGNGLGGMGLSGIGALGTHGGRGPNNPYGTGVMLKKGDKPDLPDPTDVVIRGCTEDGTGCLDKELIRRVIRANLAGFKYCYESMLNRFPSLEGKVSVRFMIAQSGKVSLATVAQSTAGNAELERCVEGRTKLLQFPSRKGTELIAVTYPFIFRQSGK